MQSQIITQEVAAAGSAVSDESRVADLAAQLEPIVAGVLPAAGPALRLMWAREMGTWMMQNMGVEHGGVPA